MSHEPKKDSRRVLRFEIARDFPIERIWFHCDKAGRTWWTDDNGKALDSASAKTQAESKRFRGNARDGKKGRGRSRSKAKS